MPTNDKINEKLDSIFELMKDLRLRVEEVASNQIRMEKATNDKFDALRNEMNKKFDAFRSEMNQKFDALRSEMNKKFELLYNQMSRENTDLRNEMNKKFDWLFGEMNKRLDLLEKGVRKDMRADKKLLDAQIFYMAKEIDGLDERLGIAEQRKA